MTVAGDGLSAVAAQLGLRGVLKAALTVTLNQGRPRLEETGS